MTQRYSVFFKSIAWMLGITTFFLMTQSIVRFNILGEIKSLFNHFSVTDLSLIFKQFVSHFSLINMINTLFLVALLFFCIYCFKWILDQGAFYTFQYSWQKTKRYVLFFLPKYWPTKKNIDKQNDYDEETGKKIFHTFEEFYEHKQASKWEDINQLLLSSIVLVIFTTIISFMII